MRRSVVGLTASFIAIYSAIFLIIIFINRFISKRIHKLVLSIEIILLVILMAGIMYFFPPVTLIVFFLGLAISVFIAITLFNPYFYIFAGFIGFIIVAFVILWWSQSPKGKITIKKLLH